MSNNRLEKLLEYYNNDPNDPFLLFALAKEYENSDMLDKALESYLKLQKEHPEYLGLYYHLGKLYENIQELILALQIYETGIEKAKAQEDFHSLSELKNAKIDLEIELGN